MATSVGVWFDHPLKQCSLCQVRALGSGCWPIAGIDPGVGCDLLGTTQLDLAMHAVPMAVITKLGRADTA
jgi:hypothetical protein